MTTAPLLILGSRDEKTRTSDLHVPNVARYQLCYIPILQCSFFEQSIAKLGK